MLYAIGEIIAFLSIAALLGFALGWMVRGISGSKRLELLWRSLVEGERMKAARMEAELERYRVENEALRDRVRSLSSGIEGVPEAVEETAGADEGDSHTIEAIANRNRPALEVDDDLKRIRGIGPVLEGLLKSKGIISYRQVALFGEEDIKHVAEAIGSFPGRILKDNWVESARQQHRLKYGSEP